METNVDTSFLPDTPGCYIFWDRAGDCLYVGKSKKLRSRVRSYFNKSTDPKVKKLAKLIARIEYQPAASEVDALYLEHSLIKTYRPPFNSQLKKDLHPHYICIQWGRAMPGLYISDRPGAEATRYGSFSSVYDAKEALGVLNRAWRTPMCEVQHFDKLGRGCLNMHIGRCLGPCQAAAQNEEAENYRNNLLKAAAFMQGRNKQPLAALKREMNQAVQDMDFENAARVMDVLAELQALQRRFAYRVPFIGRRLCILVQGYNEPGCLLLYYKNGQLRHWARIESPEDWQGKQESFILGMVKTRPSGQEYIYTSAATIEIRARKRFIDVTKTGKANLQARLTKAINGFLLNGAPPQAPSLHGE